MDLKKSLGYYPHKSDASIGEQKLIQYINLKLAALGFSTQTNQGDSAFLDIARPLLNNHREKDRLLSNYLCPADGRIQKFLNDYLEDVIEKDEIRLPVNTFILDRHGLARNMSLPQNGDCFESDIVSSYRVRQGVLHNPKNDRRTTKGAFHIADGGLPIPGDKLTVPKDAFAKLLSVALRPPRELLRLPFTSNQENQAELFVSLLLRPTVCPEVPGFISKKSTEIRFFAPGNLVGNLDFVESIFGNCGDPYLPENNASLDVEHWTGHTGCVILAPHLITLKKKDLGLPHYDKATEKQRRDGMCWKNEDELYNDGNAFKVTCRDERGVMVTIIADNYFGYCKKEVKTQISFSSNLYGLTEEEHSGGAIAFPSYDLGEEFHLDESLPQNNMTFKDVATMYRDLMNVQPEGYGIDKQFSNIFYVPEDSVFNLIKQSITWRHNNTEQKIRLLASNSYILPSGYKIHMQQQFESHNWRLVGTVAEGTLCHKPCTVSGGGKSEISKSIGDAMLQGPIFSSNFQYDIEMVSDILKRDFGDRFRIKFNKQRASRPILSSKRSLGSVIKLFTPSSEFSDEYNNWLNSLPQHIKDIIYVIKRHYKPEWGDNWREHFSVDMVNGSLGHELKYENNKLAANYLRVGNEEDGSWRIYKLRQDYNSAEKLQAEDDITASVVVPARSLNNLNPEYHNDSVKMVINCEYRLFQRPDDCVYRGRDKQAEEDLSGPNVFLSNFEPLKMADAKEIIEDAMGFDQYSTPIKDIIKGFMDDQKPEFFVSSAHPRIINGKPTKNPRYLQNRMDLTNPRLRYLAEVRTRLFRKIPLNEPVHSPVNAVLPGRRNNPPDEKLGIPPLAVYNPIHYQELPELFMDFICSVTGKSPSTTGFGSEGALTKGPFNALFPSADLNNTLVSYILTGYAGFSSAAGYIGPKMRVEHDISLLIPEIWCRMSVKERDPKFLIKNGYFEKITDFDHNGKKVQASLLGYRITIRFVHAFLGRIFNNPHAVFSKEMLKPERQDMDLFAEGLQNIVATQQRVAQNYLDDQSVNSLCPPLQALIHIMANGTFEGKDINHPGIRKMFTKDYLLKSKWYQERLETKQARDIALWTRHTEELEHFLRKGCHSEAVVQLEIRDRLDYSKKQLAKVESEEYLKGLQGTIGADPFTGQFKLQPADKTLSKSK